MNRQRRRWLVAFSALPWLAPAQAAPSARALARLQQAEARRDRLRALVQQWREIENRAGRQVETTAGLARSLASLETAQDEADRGVGKALAAIAPLRGTTESTLAALAAVLAGAEQSRQAVAVVATAGTAQLPAAARAGDAAFATRRDSERSFALAGEGLRLAARSGRQSADSARRDLDGVRSRSESLKIQAGVVVASQADLLERHAAASAALRSSVKLDRVAGVREPAPLPALAAVAALPAALAGPGAVAGAALDSAPLASLATDEAALQDTAAAALRLRDATAYLELVGGSEQAALAAEYRGFVAQQAGAQSALAAARERLLRDAQEAEALSAALAASLALQLATLAALRPQVANAGDEARLLAGQMAATAAALRPALEAAERAATVRWRAAYRAAYGQEPVEVVHAVAAAAGANGRPPLPGPSASMRPDLRGHAYDFFDTWNAEREGFGAYTYVLLRSAADLDQRDVRKRYEELLGVVQTQSDARDVRPEDAPALNLFCIPVVAARERMRPDLNYGAALGCQVKVRMQSGLFTRPELRARLTASPGPFLLTLPQRIDAASAASPLLFADLTTYPADAITDLATNYMGSLLKDFPTQQTLWKPPVPQRVALSLIWFAHEAGALFESAIPPAQARPARP
ncbi:MAG: hypothetical protein ABI699_05105 [Caldimonas sp.]